MQKLMGSRPPDSACIQASWWEKHGPKLTHAELGVFLRKGAPAKARELAMGEVRLRRENRGKKEGAHGRYLTEYLDDTCKRVGMVAFPLNEDLLDLCALLSQARQLNLTYPNAEALWTRYCLEASNAPDDIEVEVLVDALTGALSGSDPHPREIFDALCEIDLMVGACEVAQRAEVAQEIATRAMQMAQLFMHASVLVEPLARGYVRRTKPCATAMILWEAILAAPRALARETEAMEHHAQVALGEYLKDPENAAFYEELKARVGS